MMLAIPIMVTSTSGGLETIQTLGIQNVGGDEEIGDYLVTIDGVIRAEVKGFDRTLGARMLLLEALLAIEGNTGTGTYIKRKE